LLTIHILLFLLGLFLLYLGAELLVRGASRLALILRISPIVVGLTVVAFGTSSPEFLVSFVAAYNGNIDVAVGNIVGSNIANIGLIIGLSALIKPIVGFKDDIKSELYWLLGVSFVFWFFAFNNIISHVEGILLFAGIIIFTAILVKESIKDRKPNDLDVPPISTGFAIIDRQSEKIRMLIFALWALLGIGILGYGSDMTIDSAVFIAAELGISQVVIGLTMVAFGTSLPELATAIISIIKNENQILIGNIIGSNLFNMLAVAGPIAAIFPIPFSEHVIWFDFPVMIFFTVVLFLILLIKQAIPRILGLVILGLYIFYIVRVVVQ